MHTLKSTRSFVLLTRERNLCNFGIKLIDDLAVDDLTHLIILFDRKTAFVTRPIHSLGHHGAACFIRSTEITVYPAPAIFAFTCPLIRRSNVSILPIG